MIYNAFYYIATDGQFFETPKKHKEVSIKKVLILDDEPEILELWLTHFKHFDILTEVHTAKNGEEGLKLAETVDNYNLIITDYKMPILNGLNFIIKLRLIENYKKTPVFFFTGYMPELKDNVDVLDNVLLFEKSAVTDKIKTHIRLCLKENH